MSALAFVSGSGAIVLVQAVLFDVMDDRDGYQVADAHVTPQEKTDLGAADVILNQLLDDMDVFLPSLQGCESFIDIGSAAFHDKGLGIRLARGARRLDKQGGPYTVFSKNVVEILLAPDAGC